jgi:signal transduction histidine kinase
LNIHRKKRLRCQSDIPFTCFEKPYVKIDFMDQAHELTERVKELQCLYSISALVQQKDLILSTLLRKIANLIPSAWQYPESACARVFFEGQAYESDNFKETKWKQSSYILVPDGQSGSVEVYYLEEKPQEDEGPFLSFERKLIESIAKLLAETIERRKAEDGLHRVFHHQAAVSQLGLQALKGMPLNVLMNEAVQLTARLLDVPYCQVLEHPLERDVLILRASIGWSEKEIGRTVMNLDNHSQAGYTLLQNESVVVKNLEQETRFRDLNLFQNYHLVSGMSVVIQGTKSPFGVMGVHTKHERVFAPDELNFLESIANILAAAVERTKAERAMKDYQLQLRTLASQLSMAEQHERLKIATQLHDSVTQNLAMSKMKLSAIQQLPLPDYIANEISALRTLLEKTIRSIRSLSFDLSPPILHDLGLEAALEWLAEKMEQEHSIRVQLEDDANEKPLDENLRNLLFVMVRELLINVAKHANTTDAKISVWREGNLIQIEVQDKGCGFEPSTNVLEANSSSGFGLFSIRERLRHFGGRLAIQSAVGSGTRVRLTAPLKLQTKEELK